MEFAWFTSVHGIAGATLIAVEILKRGLGNVSIAMRVPTWLYAVLVSAALTYASYAYGYLTDQGTVFELVARAVISAAEASGFWTWYSQLGAPIGDSAPAQAARSPRF